MKLRAIIVFGASIVSLTSCVRPEIRAPETQIDEALGTEHAIHFRFDREPIDATEEEPRHLTRTEAIRRALLHDPRIQSSLARVRQAEAEADQSRLLANPVLSVAFRIPESGGKTVVEAGLATELLSILGRPWRVSAADNRLRASCAEAVGAALDVLLEVSETYSSVQALDAVSNLVRERKTFAAKLLDLARLRVDAGETSRLDLIAVQAESAAIDAESTAKELERRSARLELARLIGRPTGAAVWTVDPWARSEQALGDEERWIAAAVENRPEVRAQRWELAALGDERSIRWLSLLDGAEIGAEGEREDGWSVGPGVSFPFPIFDLGGSSRRQADARLAEARHKLTEIERTMVEEARKAFATLASTTVALKSVERSLLPIQEERVEQAREQYSASLIDITDLLLAEQALRAARMSVIELELKHSSARNRLDRAVGGPAVADRLFATGVRQSSNPVHTEGGAPLRRGDGEKVTQ